MRQEDVEVIIKIPLFVPDANNVVYTKESVKDAIKNFTPNCPLLTGEKIDKVIGIVKNIELSNDEAHMIIKANVFAAGTCEDVKIENNQIVEYRITSCGLGT